MASNTRIEWAANADGSPGETWNPVRARDRETGGTGTWCVHVSEGCRNCYAETWQSRRLPDNGLGLPYTAPYRDRVEIYLDEKMLHAPLRARKPKTWFLSSMTDVFGDFVPDAMIDKLFAVMALSPHHTFVVLTKRSARMRAHLRGPLARERVEDIAFDQIDTNYGGRDAAEAWYSNGGAKWPLPNVILGVSVEDQPNADTRIPDLLAAPAAWRAVSAEPLLGPVDLTRIPRDFDGEPLAFDALDGRWHENAAGFFPGYVSERLNWVIAGGESGGDARPMHPDWARSLRDQCATAGVPFFFKQWGEWAPTLEGDHRVTEGLRGTHGARFDDSGVATIFQRGGGHGDVFRVGKRHAGRLLDGQEHNGRPAIFAAAQQGAGPIRDARDTNAQPAPGSFPTTSATGSKGNRA